MKTSESQEMRMEDIRSESGIFKWVLGRHIDRILTNVPNMVKSGKGLEKNEVYATYLMIRFLHGMVKPYAGTDYKKLELDLEGLVSKELRYNIIDQIAEGFENAIMQFGRVGLLPPIPGYGEVKGADWETDW